MIWLLLTLLACGDGAPDDTALIDCAGLDEDACEQAESCYGTPGLSIHGEHSCEDPGPPEFAGCRTRPSRDDDCDDIHSFVAPPDAPELCWVIGDSCIPDGWVECDPPNTCDW